MTIVKTGSNVDLILMVILLLVMIVVFSMARRSEEPFGTMRPIVAMEHLEESIGRCAEMNKSVHFTSGWWGVTGATALDTLAGISILGYVSELCASYNVPLRDTVSNAYKYQLEKAAVRDGFVRAGHVERFQEDYVNFPGGGYFSWSNGVSQYLLKERPGASFFFGNFLGAGTLMSETSARSGALSIGSAIGYGFIFIMTCDYFTLGEELYASGAYASRDKDALASIAGTDIGKVIVLIILLIGVILKYAGSEYILNLLNV